MIDKMWSELTIQEYWKGSCDRNLIFAALSSINYDNLPVSLSVSLYFVIIYVYIYIYIYIYIIYNVLVII